MQLCTASAKVQKRSYEWSFLDGHRHSKRHVNRVVCRGGDPAAADSRSCRFIHRRAQCGTRPDSGLASVFGITTGTLVHVLASTLGLSALLASSTLAFAVVKYAGAGYLIYMGVRRIVKRTDTSTSPLELPRRSLGRLYRDGFIVNLLNPKTALFFLAFLPQFVDPSRGAVPFQIAFLGLLFTLMGLTSDGLYALVAGTAGVWVKRQSR
jgi:threonine/homoserine/homoserine lactone efflux protein